MRSPVKVSAAVLIAIAAVMLSAGRGHAEWLGAIFAGASVTNDHNVVIHDTVVGRGIYRDTEFGTSLGYGGRFGRYFDTVPYVGLAVDFFKYTPNIPPQAVRGDGCFIAGGCFSGAETRTGRIDIDTTTLSLDLMLRLPLFKTENEPRGVVQPYLAVGAPIFFTNVTPRSTRQFRNQEEQSDVSIGYKAAAGISVRVYKNLDVLGEYRYTHTSVDVDLRDSSLARTRLQTELNTHSFLIGLGVRW
jgi:opacity protein-like surface antigen